MHGARRQPSRGYRKGSLFLSPGCGLYLGPLLENAAHAHHALQISVPLVGPLRLQARAGGRWRPYGGVITTADQLHRMRCEGIVAQLYLDPQSRPARQLTSAMAPRTVNGIPAAALAGMRGPLRRCWEEAGGGNQWEQAFDEALEALTPADETGGSLDDRVAEVLELLHAAPGKSVPLSVLARGVALSPGRLGHLFSSQVGLPMRRYVLWLRLIDAIHRMARGAALTEAAHGADFSDSAHLSRTFRRMFGMAPSSLVDVAMFVRAHPVTSPLGEAGRWPG